MDLFDCLPLSCFVNDRFLCIHGGISHDLKSFDDIVKINRFREIPKDGLFCDLMWADPINNENGYCQGGVQPNNSRGCSYYFGADVATTFFEKNKVKSIIRAH